MAVGGKKGLRFHGNCLNAMKVHTDKKQENIKKNVIEVFSDRNAPENLPVNRLGTHKRHRSRRSETQGS